MSEPITEPTVTDPTPPVVEPQGFAWKDRLSADLQSAPGMDKFSNDPEGLGKAMTSYHNLEKMLGHEKVVIPKDKDDKEAWSMFNKATGVPESADKYELSDYEVPENLKDVTFDKEQFSEIVHGLDLRPDQAQGLWEKYTTLQSESYKNTMEGYQTQVDDNITALKEEWGQAYKPTVEAVEQLVNKFAGEGADAVFAQAGKDTALMRTLGEITKQFKENDIGDFKGQTRFAKTPAEAQEELNRINLDDEHPYWAGTRNTKKLTDSQHKLVVDNYIKLQNIATGVQQG